MNIITSLDQLAEDNTMILLDGSIITTDYNLDSVEIRVPDFAKHIGAKSRVSIRCGGSLGYRGISSNQIRRQKRHVEYLLGFVQQNSHVITTPDVLDEYATLITHLGSVQKIHRNGKKGKKEKLLEECAEIHREIYGTLHAHLQDQTWPELVNYIREAKLHVPRRNILLKRGKPSYSPEDAGIVVAAMKDSFNLESTIAIVTQDFDIANIVFQLGEDILMRKLSKPLEFMYTFPLNPVTVYFPATTGWIPEHNVQFMVDSKMNIFYYQEGQNEIVKFNPSVGHAWQRARE